MEEETAHYIWIKWCTVDEEFTRLVLIKMYLKQQFNEVPSMLEVVCVKLLYAK